MSEVERLYRPREAARLLGCGMTKLYEVIGRGDLPAVKDGRTTLIPASGIARYQSNLAPASIGRKAQG